MFCFFTGLCATYITIHRDAGFRKPTSQSKLQPIDCGKFIIKSSVLLSVKDKQEL